jgi:uncharacterized membrane protein YhiD involved in acid resistance
MLRDPWTDEAGRLRNAGAGAERAAPRGTSAPALRQAYRLALVCHAADSEAVEASLRTLLERNALALDSLQRDRSGVAFVRITVLLASTISERATLVQIVNQLATMPSIRRLQWETVPQARSAPAPTQ